MSIIKLARVTCAIAVVGAWIGCGGDGGKLPRAPRPGGPLRRRGTLQDSQGLGHVDGPGTQGAGPGGVGRAGRFSSAQGTGAAHGGGFLR